MSYAVLFAGQASQHPDMLPWLESEPACRAALQLMGPHLGVDWRRQLYDPAARTRNSFAQVLITGTALAAWSAVEQYLPEGPAVVAGYSVGELAAFGSAGVLTMAQAIDLSALRARLMDQAVSHLSTGLLAVTGMAELAVLNACATLKLECAIRVAQHHTIFAGTDDGLTQALPLLTALGAHCTRLDIRVASHSSWMLAAAKSLAKVLRAVPFTQPQFPIALNASGQISRQPGRLQEALAQQLANTVQWSSVMDVIAERRVSCVLEVGGGSALSRIWNEQYGGIPARALDDFRHPRSAADWIKKACAIGA